MSSRPDRDDAHMNSRVPCPRPTQQQSTYQVEARDLTRRSVAAKGGEESVFIRFPNPKMVTRMSQNEPNGPYTQHYLDSAI